MSETNRNLVIRGVSGPIRRKMRLLSIGLDKTMAQLLQLMVERTWEERADTILVDSKAKKRLKKLLTRHPGPL